MMRSPTLSTLINLPDFGTPRSEKKHTVAEFINNNEISPEKNENRIYNKEFLSSINANNFRNINMTAAFRGYSSYVEDTEQSFLKPVTSERKTTMKNIRYQYRNPSHTFVTHGMNYDTLDREESFSHKKEIEMYSESPIPLVTNFIKRPTSIIEPNLRNYDRSSSYRRSIAIPSSKLSPTRKYYDDLYFQPHHFYNEQMHEPTTNYFPLCPVASRSLLTCNQEFQSQFPIIYIGLCKGLIDVNRLISQEIVIPIKEDVNLHMDTLRSRRAIIAAVSDVLWKPLYGKFPDSAIAPRLIYKIANYICNKLERSIQEAEDERTFFQWFLRRDVENTIDIRLTTSTRAGTNSIISNIEGTCLTRRKKGIGLSLIHNDTLVINMDLILKAIFLNGGQLLQINNDPRIVERINFGTNRLAASFVC